MSHGCDWIVPRTLLRHASFRHETCRDCVPTTQRPDEFFCVRALDGVEYRPGKIREARLLMIVPPDNSFVLKAFLGIPSRHFDLFEYRELLLLQADCKTSCYERRLLLWISLFNNLIRYLVFAMGWNTVASVAASF